MLTAANIDEMIPTSGRESKTLGFNDLIEDQVGWISEP